MITDKFFVYVDSRKRIEGNDSSFKYEINFPPHKVYSHVCVLRLAIPKSYYLINKPNNYFFLEEETEKEDENGTLVPFSERVRIELPVGNVGRRTFVRNVLTLLNMKSPNKWIYDITYTSLDDFDDGKLGFAVSVDEESPLLNEDGKSRFIFEDGLYEQFGFDQRSTNECVNGYMESKNVIKFQAEDTLYLHSDIIKKDRRSVLQDVFVANSLPYSNIVWECNDIHCNSKELSNNTNEVVSFSLTDENDFLINLNGLNMVFTLLFYNRKLEKELQSFSEVPSNFQN